MRLFLFLYFIGVIGFLTFIILISNGNVKNKNLKQEILKKNKIIDFLSEENLELKRQIEDFDSRLKKFSTDPISWISKNYKSHNLGVTAYSPSKSQCDENPFIAASNKLVEEFTIAVSQNMRRQGWSLGKFVYICELDKFFKIHDVLNRRYQKRMDIFFWNEKEALNFGYKNLKVYLID